jgi:PBSX family phage terminase large subunit
MTLYPESFIHMLDTRLRKPHSMGFAAMNPSHPNHIVKKWIDHAIAGHPKYYHLHFVLDDNPYLPPDYKETIGSSLSGIFYKRNFLGLWCLAEGAIFDFFEKEIHVAERPPEAAEYWIAGIDFGLNNPFAAVLIGVSTGRFNQTGRHWWVEQEFYWDFKKQNEPKTVSDLARDVYNFLEPYAVRAVYLDPSALAMKNDLSRLGIYTAETNNEVEEGIAITANEIRQGRLTILKHCKNLIKEIEGYVWDPKQAEKGYDAPLKQHDHLIDATRYCVASHKIPEYKPYKEGHDPDSYRQGRFSPGKRKF